MSRTDVTGFASPRRKVASKMPRNRSGVTLVEILVVTSILGLLAALLIPAVQSSRESARMATCRNNLRQLALATVDFESTHRQLPGLWNGTFLPAPRSPLDEFHFHPWRTMILPGVEQSGLFNALNLARPSTTFDNLTALNVRVSAFLCPSTSNPSVVVPLVYEWNDPKLPLTIPLPPPRPLGPAERSDYESIAGVAGPSKPGAYSFDLSPYRFGAWGEPTYTVRHAAPWTSARYREARLSDVLDGLSNTILVAERSGRPDRYLDGRLERAYSDDPASNSMDPHQAAWGLTTHFPWLTFPDRQSVNRNNYGIYAFHPAGAHAAMADGSVRLLKASMDAKALAAAVTRAGGEAEAVD